MRVRSVRPALCGLLWFAAGVAIGCDCADNEYDAVEACDKVTAAVNAVLKSCQQTEMTTNDVCGGSVCDTVTSCKPKGDIDACTAAIAKLDCTSVGNNAYKELAECVPVLDKMADSCSSSDDDDWD